MIIRATHRDRYVTLAKTALEDPKLSLKAKGLWAYLMSKPDTWVVMVAHLISIGPDGRVAIMSALRELEDAGYVVRQERGRRDDGTWDLATTVVYETSRSEPVSEIDSGDAQTDHQGEREKALVVTSVDYPRADNPRADNRHLVSNEGVSNEGVSNEGVISLSSARDSNNVAHTPEREAIVDEALTIIADRRVDAAKAGGVRILNRRAYTRTVREDAAEELAEELAKRSANNPAWSAEDLASMFVPRLDPYAVAVEYR